MFFESIQRHLAVCAQNDLPQIAKLDPAFWNVISIREPARPKIPTLGFKRIHALLCYDIIGPEGLDPSQLGIPRKEHLQDIFRFIDGMPTEPILVHCWAGVSRSAAVALAIIARGLYYDGFSSEEIVQQGPEMLLQIRRIAAPNPLILELGLSCFLSEEQARKLAVALVNHPILYRNRMNADPES